MEYFRELINTLDDISNSQVKMERSIAKSCIPAIEQCEKIEREFNEKLDKEILNQFNNYRTMIHCIVDGLVVEELANACVRHIFMQNGQNSKNKK